MVDDWVTASRSGRVRRRRVGGGWRGGGRKARREEGEGERAGAWGGAGRSGAPDLGARAFRGLTPSATAMPPAKGAEEKTGMERGGSEGPGLVEGGALLRAARAVPSAKGALAAVAPGEAAGGMAAP